MKKKHFNYEKYQCRFCKTEGDIEKQDLMKSCKNSNGHQYYCCRKCNTKRLKEYRKTNNGKKSQSLAVKKSTLKYPEKRRAWNLVQLAINNGKLQKQPCEICGEEKSETHHDDYSNPLKVKWLCRQCHANLHKNKKLL